MPIPIPISTVYKIPSGDRGTDATVAAMRSYIRRGSLDPEIRNLAVALTYNLENSLEKATAIFNFVQSRMAYVRDNLFVETLQSPKFMAASFLHAGLAFGDCDDHAIFLGSLLVSIGFPVKIVTVRVKPGAGGFDHVYLKTFVDNIWIGLDATNKNKPAGWAVPYKKIKEYRV